MHFYIASVASYCLDCLPHLLGRHVELLRPTAELIVVNRINPLD
jgi:hypothetical protein